jgi:hypothetical protein
MVAAAMMRPHGPSSSGLLSRREMLGRAGMAMTTPSMDASTCTSGGAMDKRSLKVQSAIVSHGSKGGWEHRE